MSMQVPPGGTQGASGAHHAHKGHHGHHHKKHVENNPENSQNPPLTGNLPPGAGSGLNINA